MPTRVVFFVLTLKPIIVALRSWERACLGQLNTIHVFFASVRPTALEWFRYHIKWDK